MGPSDEFEFEETKMELDMTIDDIKNEPKDSVKIPRCKKCRRMCFGHDGPTGTDNCKLDVIENDEELKMEDEKMNKI